MAFSHNCSCYVLSNKHPKPDRVKTAPGLLLVNFYFIVFNDFFQVPERRAKTQKKPRPADAGRGKKEE
jgi:hypothetical protein